MPLYFSEEDLASLQRQGRIRIISETPTRKPLPCVPPAPSGVSVAQMNGNDLPGIAEETAPSVKHQDEIDVWPNAAEAIRKSKRNKYGNRRVIVDGMAFDSQHEADYYFSTLLPWKQIGELKLLLRQVPFELPGGIKYIADFLTVDKDGEVTVIDAKSEATRKNRTYINKRKQVKAIYGLDILEV